MSQTAPLPVANTYLLLTPFTVKLSLILFNRGQQRRQILNTYLLMPGTFPRDRCWGGERAL